MLAQGSSYGQLDKYRVRGPSWCMIVLDNAVMAEQTYPEPLIKVSYLQAVRAALEDELAADERVVLLGEDIGVLGGAFRVTEGLQALFGDQRVIDTPMAEIAIVGASIGMAVRGLRPVAELQFADFISCSYDQLANEAAKLHYRFGIAVPIVVRAPSGGGIGMGPFHSQSPEGVFAHIPGLKIACPATVQDAYDLLRAAVADPNPVLFFEHKRLYRSLDGFLVRNGAKQQLGNAAICRTGDDLTMITYGGALQTCLEVAGELEQEGLSIEVLDLRSIAPLDRDAIVASVTKTSHVVIVHEDTYSSGIGAEIAALLSEHAFFSLDAPIARVTAPDLPVPLASCLEAAYIPNRDRVMAAVRECLET